MKKLIRHYNHIIGILIGVFLAVVVGSFLPELGLKSGFLGTIFLNALKMIVLPLIIVSITLSIMKVGSIGSLGIKTLIYYLTTTAIAVFIGILIVSIIQPGVESGIFKGAIPEAIIGKEGLTFVDLLKGLISPNLFESAAKFKILPLIIASILFGIAFAALGKENEVIVEIFSLVDRAVMKIVQWIIIFTPIGVFGLIANRLGMAGGGSEVMNLALQLGKYVGCVLLGLFIHGFVVLPLILYVLSRRNPINYFSNLSKALLTAFATASSSATLPLTMAGAIEEAKVSKKVGRFVLPLGATINMDGTALYEAVAVIFIAQSYGIHLGLGKLIVVFLTASLAAIGAAGIPEAGLVTMVLVLQAVGLPLEGIGLILSIDWLLDRFRTTINVWGDCVGAAVLDRLEAKEIRDAKVSVEVR